LWRLLITRRPPIDAERSGVELQSPKFKHLSENELNILEFCGIKWELAW